MARDSIFALVPGVIFSQRETNEMLREDFTIEEGIVIRNYPFRVQFLKSHPLHPPTPLLGIEEAMIRAYPWLIEYNVEGMESENPLDNLTGLNTKEFEVITRLPLLAAIKYQINFFPNYLFHSNPDRTIFYLFKQWSIPTLLFSYWPTGIDKGQLTELKRLLLTFKNRINYSTRFYLATDLLLTSFFEESFVTALVLLFAALESLFNESREEISHKLRTRTACFLASSIEEREEVRDEINKSYNVRSRIVHGQLDLRNEDTQKELSEALRKTRQYLCQVLERFIEDEEVWKALKSKESYNSFLKKLDMGESNP